MTAETRDTSRLIRAHGIAALVGLVVSELMGLAVSIKFHAPGFLNGAAALTWGRLRYDHTQGILYAWLGNAFLAFLYYAVPKLAGRGVRSARLGWILFWAWNAVAVLGGWSLVLAGVSQPLEWAEFPLGIAAVIEIAWVLVFLQFLRPLLKVGAGELYVAGWYLLGGGVFTALAYPVGNLAPRFLPGAMGASFSGLWIHDAVGLFITPFAVAIAYFVIPAVTRKPIYSHFYSMVGFWLLFLVYPLNGIHHYIFSSLPMSSQFASEIASLYQGLDVILVVANLLLSIPALGAALRDVPLRFVWTSVVLYLIVSLQGSVQAVMPVNRFLHYSDWVIGHSHLAMIGFASFAAMGGLAHVWERTPGLRMNRRMLGWAYWLMVAGLVGMVADLTMAGIAQGHLWRGPLPWIDSVRASRVYWVARTHVGSMLLLGFVAFGVSLLTGKVNEAAEERAVEEVEPQTGRAALWLNTAYAATFGAGLVFFVVSFTVLGILPAVRLHAEMVSAAPRGVVGLTAAEAHGREIYAREGCGYCHTEQVRNTRADIRRFGRPTSVWETSGEFPQIWGTRRIGPDLAREGLRRRADWQFVHLYNPRATVPDSVMPAYPGMFDGGVDRPGRDARDLLAYLTTLGRAAGMGAEPPEPAMPAAPELRGVDGAAEGKNIFLHNCSGCHGAAGDGKTAGGAALEPPAFDLTGAAMQDGLIWRALWHGVDGASMPAWHTLPAEQIRAVAAYTATLGQAGELREEERWAPDAVLGEAGRRVYVTHCSRCHGENGAADGKDAKKKMPYPANFHELRPSYALAARVIHEGVAGTAMQAWPLLTPAEIQAVTFYIRGFSTGAAR